MKCLMELDKYEISWSEKLAYLTWRFLDEQQIGCPVSHKFEDGWYIREMCIPKETLFIGRPHRYGHRCELVSGKLLHIEEYIKRVIYAPFEMTTKPGYQMALYAMQDVVGRTYHLDTGVRDVEKLEADIFHPLNELKTLGSQVAQRLFP
jgi:hypothetical protein